MRDCNISVMMHSILIIDLFIARMHKDIVFTPMCPVLQEERCVHMHAGI